MAKKTEEVVSETTKVNEIKALGLNLDIGRQDLDNNFRAIQEKINEIIKKVN